MFFCVLCKGCPIQKFCQLRACLQNHSPQTIKLISWKALSKHAPGRHPAFKILYKPSSCFMEPWRRLKFPSSAPFQIAERMKLPCHFPFPVVNRVMISFDTDIILIPVFVQNRNNIPPVSFSKSRHPVPCIISCSHNPAASYAVPVNRCIFTMYMHNFCTPLFQLDYRVDQLYHLMCRFPFQPEIIIFYFFEHGLPGFWMKSDITGCPFPCTAHRTVFNSQPYPFVLSQICQLPENPAKF